MANPKTKAIIACIFILLAGFTLLSWLASQTKSPTYDESQHSLGGWVALHYHDYRLNAENLPLWTHWAALPNPRTE